MAPTINANFQATPNSANDNDSQLGLQALGRDGPPSNADFLTAIAGPLHEGEHFHVAGFAVAPKAAESKHWAGRTWDGEGGREALDLRTGDNNYFSVAVLSDKGEAGKRKTVNFERLMALVADDPEVIPPDPNWVLQTSEGKCQVGFILRDDEQSRDVGLCSRAIKAMVEAKLIPKDKSGNNPVRYARLAGSNTKTEPPFRTEWTVWNPDLPCTLTEALQAFGVDLATVEQPPATKPETVPSSAPAGEFEDLTQPAEVDLGKLGATLFKIDATCHRDDWIRCGMALKEEAGDTVEAFDLYHTWSATAGNAMRDGKRVYPGRAEVKAKWDSFGKYEGDLVKWATVEMMARDAEAGKLDGFYDLGEGDDGDLGDDLPAPEKKKRLTAIERIRERAATRSLDRLKPTAVMFNVHGWLQRGQAGLMAAAGSTGKTTLILYLAVCHALGRDFMGCKVLQGATFILSGDDSQDDLDIALGDVCRAMGLDDSQMQTVVDHVVVASVRGYAENLLIQTDPKNAKAYTHTQFAADLKRELAKVPDLRLVSLDTARQFTGTESVDEAAQMRLMSVAAILASVPSLPTVCVNSHTGKQAARSKIEDMYAVIGSSALADNARFVLLLRTLDENDLKSAEFAPIASAGYALMQPPNPEGFMDEAEGPDWCAADEPVFLQLVSTRGSLRVRKPAPAFYVRRGFRLDHLDAHKLPKAAAKAQRAVNLRDDLLDFIGKNPGCSGRAITGRTRAPGVPGTADLLVDELKAMASEGLITIKEGKGNAHNHWLA